MVIWCLVMLPYYLKEKALHYMIWEIATLG